MSKPSNKQTIIDAGLQVLFRKGYHGAGVRDVVAAAKVPQGSFTNHFASKEAFAGEVLELYFARTRDAVHQALDDRSKPPRQRLLDYFALITERLEADGFTRGCLIGDFSIELSQTSEVLRTQLADIYRVWLEPFEQCISEGQASGNIPSDFAPADLAEFLISAWEGAILRMKVEQNAAPLLRFRQVVSATVLRPGH
ncbi:MAG: TetR family transcriptional regulator [Rhizobium sp.]|nr:MAG: TetR family transcriptional regulator [Rhizobium sp.]